MTQPPERQTGIIKYYHVDDLVCDLDPPVREQPDADAVAAMIESLERDGLRAPLVATCQRGDVVVVDGRTRVHAISAMNDDGRLPLPCQTDATNVPVELLEPGEAIARLLETLLKLAPPRPATRIRTIQELMKTFDVKEFYTRQSIARYGGQPAGHQHQKGWPGLLADQTDMTRQRTGQLVSIAKQVPEAVVCQLMGTPHETDATFTRLKDGIKGGWNPEQALAHVTTGQGAQKPGKAKDQPARMPDVEQVAAGLSALTLADKDAYFRDLRARMSPETFDRARRAFGLRGHRGAGRQGPSAAPEECDRVGRRLHYLFEQSELKLAIGDVAAIANLGEASVNALYNYGAQTGKRQVVVDDIDRALDKLAVPHDPR